MKKNFNKGCPDCGNKDALLSDSKTNTLFCKHCGYEEELDKTRVKTVRVKEKEELEAI